MSLQAGWQKSMARLNCPTARKAARYTLRDLRREGRGRLFRLEGSGVPDAFAAERIAALLHADLRQPVTVVIRYLPCGRSVRGYCDAGTNFNISVQREVAHG